MVSKSRVQVAHTARETLPWKLHPNRQIQKLRQRNQVCCRSAVQINVRACLSSKKWLFPLQMTGILGKIYPNELEGERMTRYPGIFLTKGCQLLALFKFVICILRT